MTTLPPDQGRSLQSFGDQHVLNQSRKARFLGTVAAEQGTPSHELDDVKENYGKKRPESLEFSLKAVFQKAQAFKAAVDLASEEVTEKTKSEKAYFKGLIVSPEALVSQFRSLVSAQITSLETQVGKEERGLNKTENLACDDSVQAGYTDDLNQKALTFLPTLGYFPGDEGSEVEGRNTLIDTYEKARKDLTGEEDFELENSTAAISTLAKHSANAVETSKEDILQQLSSDFKDSSGYYSELTEEQLNCLECAFEEIELGGSPTSQNLNDLIGLLNASSIRAQKGATLEYYLRFKTFSNYVALSEDKFKKGDKKFLKTLFNFAKSLGFDDELSTFGETLSEESIYNVIFYVNDALSKNVFEVSEEVETELAPLVEELSTKLPKNQKQFDLAIQERVKKLLNSETVLDIKQLVDVEHDCLLDGIDLHYKIQETGLFLACELKKQVIEVVLNSLQSAEPIFFKSFRDSVTQKNDDSQKILKVKLDQIHADLDLALGNASGEHNLDTLDQKLSALKTLIEEKHAAITQKRDEKSDLKVQLKEAQKLTQVTKKEDLERVFKAQFEKDFVVKKTELQRAISVAESELNAVNRDVIEKAYAVANAGPDKSAAQKSKVAVSKAAHYLSLKTKDEAEVKLANAKEQLASFEVRNQKLAENIAETYIRYDDLSNAITALSAQSLKEEVTFDADLKQFTEALEGLKLETEVVAPVFAKSIQRRLAQVKAEIVAAELSVLAREHEVLQSDRSILGHIESAHLEFLQNKSESRAESIRQSKLSSDGFTSLIEATSEALTQSKAELVVLQDEFDELVIALYNLEGNKSLTAIAERGFLNQKKENSEAAIALKEVEIEALKGAFLNTNEGKSNTLHELADETAQLVGELDDKLEDGLFQASLWKTEIDLREIDAVRLQSQLNVAETDLRGVSLETQEKLLKLPPLETIGVHNPSLQLWATAQKRVEGIIAAIPTVKVEKGEVSSADLIEAVRVLKEREESVLVTIQVVSAALDDASVAFDKATGTEKVQLKEAVIALTEREASVLATLQVVSVALNTAQVKLDKAKEETLKTEVVATFEQVLGQAVESGLLSSDEVTTQVPYELIVPVLLQKSGMNFFDEFNDQEIATFVVKAVDSLSLKVGFDKGQLDQIVTDQTKTRSEISQLEIELEELVAAQKETITTRRQATVDAKANQDEITEIKQKIVQLNDLNDLVDRGNSTYCSSIESKKIELQVVLSALDSANAELGIGALEEAEEAVYLLESRQRDNPLSAEGEERIRQGNAAIQSAINQVRSNPEGEIAEELEVRLSALQKALVDVPLLSEEKQEEARIKALVTSSALEKARAHLESCREKAEAIRVLDERSKIVKLELDQDLVILDLVLNSFKKVFGASLVSLPLFLDRPITDAKLKVCVETEIADNQELEANLQTELQGFKETSSESHAKLKEIQGSLDRVVKSMDSAIIKFNDLIEEKKEVSTLKAKAYDFAFQFFGLPLSIGKALSVFCSTKDELKPIKFVRICAAKDELEPIKYTRIPGASILKKSADSADLVAPVRTVLPRKKKFRIDEKANEVRFISEEKVDAAVDHDDRVAAKRETARVMSLLGLVSSPHLEG